MARAIAFSRIAAATAQDIARTAIVASCAIALIAAGHVLPL